jgi:hypothetical protein
VFRPARLIFLVVSRVFDDCREFNKPSSDHFTQNDSSQRPAVKVLHSLPELATINHASSAIRPTRSKTALNRSL